MGEKGRMAMLTILVVLMMAGIILATVKRDEMHGFCEGKGYDGLETIDGKPCCYRVEDDSIVAVPISVLRGE